MKYLHLVLALMFIVFAAVQYNDPDPYIWIPIYGIMTVICTLAFFRIYPRDLLLILSAVFLLYSAWYFPGVREWLGQDDKAQLFDNVAKMEHPFIEESREFLGLLICVVVLVSYWLVSRKKTA